jgi:hypothetical protein
METDHKKSILLLVSNSFAVTNILHSGLLKKLSDRYRIYLIATMISANDMEGLNNRYRMNVMLLDVRLPTEGWFLRLLRQVEKAIFFALFEIETYHIKVLAERSRFRSFIQKACEALPFSLKYLILKTIRQLIVFWSSYSGGTMSGISHQHFDGIISSSPLDIRENSMVNFLSRQKIKSMAMVISWDNLTSKGIINANHDYVLVWNKFMADEFKRFYSNFKSSTRVCITGVPRFDIYFQDREYDQSGIGFKEEFGMPSEHRIILFATSSPKHFDRQHLIVEDLAEYLAQNSHVSLIIRCHPADNPEHYSLFTTAKNLHVWHPGSAVSDSDKLFYKWLPGENLLSSLADMLRNCDVCIQVASTIRLDAAASNRPVISIAYDGGDNLPYHESVRRLYDYSHQLPLNLIKVDRMVYSKQELYLELDKILSDDSSPVDYVKDVLPMIYHDEPKSVETILKCVEEWLH